jgi:predicted AlkP superfamily phosphohydrolase/phosphomutase
MTGSGAVRPRVVMIGMDAAELSLIQRHLASLPALRRILERGNLQLLESTASIFPGSVWPTFYSGQLPGEHGVYHHLQWDPDAMRLRRVAEDWLYVEPFWYELERRGFRVVAIDVPMSFPSRLVHGVEILNWGSHDELGPFSTYPRGLASDIRRRFGRHPMGSEIPVPKTAAQVQSIRQNLVAGAALKGALVRWMLARTEWDFFIAVFGETHRGGHLLWPDDSDEGLEGPRSEGGLLAVYRAVDRSIGQLAEALPKSGVTLIVFALHGMGPNTSQEHLMPKIMDQVNAGWLANGTPSARNGSGYPDKGQSSVMRSLREQVPAWVQNAIARAVSVRVRDMVVSRQISGGHDWSWTPGLALLADLNGYLRWNLRGRERDGMLDIEGEMLERYVGWVRRCLMELRVPEAGSEIVQDVVLSRDHFPGQRQGMLPDAVVTWSGAAPARQVHGEDIGSIRAEPSTGRSGNHRPDGFCVIVEPPGSAASVASPRHISELSSLACQLLQLPSNAE